MYPRTTDHGPALKRVILALPLVLLHTGIFLLKNDEKYVHCSVCRGCIPLLDIHTGTLPPSPRVHVTDSLTQEIITLDSDVLNTMHDLIQMAEDSLAWKLSMRACMKL